MDDRFAQANDPLDVITANLAELDRENGSLAERRAAHLTECASLLAETLDYSPDGDENGFLDDDFVSRYSAIFGETSARGELFADLYSPVTSVRDFQRSSAKCAEVGERVEFCRMLASECDRRFMTRGRPFALTSMLLKNLSGESDPSTPRGKVSYLRSSFADSAFSRFSGILENPTVTYARDFNSVCEDVYYGRAGNCILPVENSSEGTLASFRNLILKYELKIARTATIGVDGYSNTRFALCRRELTFPTEWSDGVVFEFCVTPHDETSLAPLLMAAVCLGLKPVKLETVPVSANYGGGGRAGDEYYAYDISCTCGRDSLDPFILYLLLQSPGFETVGIYTEIAHE